MKLAVSVFLAAASFAMGYFAGRNERPIVIKRVNIMDPSMSSWSPFQFSSPGNSELFQKVMAQIEKDKIIHNATQVIATRVDEILGPPLDFELKYQPEAQKK